MASHLGCPQVYINLKLKRSLEYSSLLSLRTVLSSYLTARWIRYGGSRSLRALLGPPFAEVSGTVRNLSIHALESSGVLDLQESFSKFDEKNGPPVTKLISLQNFLSCWQCRQLYAPPSSFDCWIDSLRRNGTEWIYFGLKNDLFRRHSHICKTLTLT